jgi:hypothetical protein
MQRVTGIGGIFFKAKDPVARRTAPAATRALWFVPLLIAVTLVPVLALPALSDGQESDGVRPDNGGLQPAARPGARSGSCRPFARSDDRRIARPGGTPLASHDPAGLA